MIKKLLIFIISLNAYTLFAQEDTGELKVNLSTPYHSLSTFYGFFAQENIDGKKASAPFRKYSKTEAEAITTAIKLKQLLDGSGIYLDMENIPNDPNYFDSVKMERSYVLTDNLKEIKLVRVNMQWVFNTQAIAEINQQHQQVFKFGTDRLVSMLPKLGAREIFGLYVYQLIGILILIFCTILFQKIVSYLTNQVMLNLVKKAGYEHLATGYLLPVARPFTLIINIFLIRVFIPVLQLPVLPAHYTLTILKALVPFFATIMFYRMANVISHYLEKVATRTTNTLDNQLVPLIRKTLKAFVVVVGTLFILDNMNIDILPLLTGLSIGGLAFALAAQDTIKNFFGSLMIFVDKPFQIGDWITSGEIDGTVEEVGFRSSRIRTFRNSLMYVPNSKLADSMVDNHGLRKYRRFYTQIAVTYDTPPELIETFVKGLRQIVERHPKTRKDYYNIYFNDMASFSLNIMFYIFFEVPTWPEELKSRHEILLEVVKLARELGINFAFPTQTLHMENFPGQPSLSPQYLPVDDSFKKMEAYFK